MLNPKQESMIVNSYAIKLLFVAKAQVFEIENINFCVWLRYWTIGVTKIHKTPEGTINVWLIRQLNSNVHGTQLLKHGINTNTQYYT